MDDQTQGHGYYVGKAIGFFAGLLVGGVVGAGAMLLLAPNSGEDTRDRIRQEGLELRNRAAETVEDAVAQARGKTGQIATDVHKQAKELQQRGQDMLDEQKDVVSAVVEAEKTALHNISKG